MKDNDNFGEEMLGYEEEISIPDPPPDLPSNKDYSGANDVGMESANKGRLGMWIFLLLLLVGGGAAFYIWKTDQAEQTKWNNELKAALKLPDGQFETALRSLLTKTDREDILAQAAFELGAVKDKEAAPALMKLIPAGNTASVEAAMALAKIGGEAGKGAKEAIFAQMGKSERLNKAKYAWALCTLGDERGFNDLVDALAKQVITPKSFPELDLNLIIQMGTTDKLIGMASSPAPTLRMYAAMELGFRSDKDVVPSLLKLIADQSDDISEAAAISLGRIADDRAGPALIQTMVSKPALKETILTSIAQSVGAPGLIAIYKNSQNDISTKYSIIGKLKKLLDPRSSDFLLSVLKEIPEGTTDKQLLEIRNQSLWTLEEMGDLRISEFMFAKTNWVNVTPEQIPDESARYRQDDMSRKIANSVVTWFGKVKPEGAADYLQKMYDANKPYSNGPDCAKRVKVDIDPLMTAMSRTGDTRFCGLITTFLDQDEKFYFQGASSAAGRLKCPGMVDNFLKRVEMTAAERKDNKFAALEEARDWQMEDRLQERKNAIIALKYFSDPKAGDKLMKIVLDVRDDQELRKEAASSLAYSADDAVMDKILSAIADPKTDLLARAALVAGLTFNPTEKAINAMFEILEGQGNSELIKPAAIVIGEAAVPAFEDRLNKILDSADPERQRAAAFAVMLSGNSQEINKVVEILKGQENRLLLKNWFQEHPIFLTKAKFESGAMFKRLTFAKLLASSARNREEQIIWPWKHLMDRVKTGWEEGPDGLNAIETRNIIMETVRSNDTYRELAAYMLSGLGNRGYLLALQGENGPQGPLARTILNAQNSLGR